MSTFIEYKKYAYYRFRNAKHPNDLLRDKEFLSQFKSWYSRVFAEIPEIRTCGVCLYEKFREMADLDQKTIDQRLNLHTVIKPGEIIWVKNTPFSRKSPHLTADLMAEIAEKHPKKVEKNPYYTPDQKESPKKTRKPRTKKVENGDNG